MDNMPTLQLRNQTAVRSRHDIRVLAVNGPLLRRPLRMRIKISLALVMIAVALATLSSFPPRIAFADNWPQWRGPLLNGVSNEKNLPVKWTTEENVTWKLPLPAWSGSTPIIWGDLIFLNVSLNLRESDELYLWCVDRKQGAV